MPFVVAYVLIFRVCAESARSLPADVATTMRNIGLLFAGTWAIYPLAYLVQVFAEDSASWAVARQVSLSFGTIAAKVGFGILSYKVARMRTAYDIADGQGELDEAVWQSQTELAPARPPLGVHLAGHTQLDGDRTTHRPGASVAAAPADPTPAGQQASASMTARE